MSMIDFSNFEVDEDDLFFLDSPEIIRMIKIGKIDLADGNIKKEVIYRSTRSLPLMKFLYENNIDLDSEYDFNHDFGRCKPLHFAIRSYCVETVRFLLEIGSNPFSKTFSGKTPMQLVNESLQHGFIFGFQREYALEIRDLLRDACGEE